MNFSELCNFTPQQWLATEQADKFRYFLYGGRRGVLKSYFLRWYNIRRLLQWASQGYTNVRVMLACEDFPTLADRQVSKMETEFPKWLGELKTTRIDGFCFFLHPRYGGGKIALRSLDKPGKYRGSEYAAITIDELTKHQEFIEPEIRLFDVLVGSLRWPSIEDSYFLSASNPDGPGQVWVREFFIEHKLPEGWQEHAHHFGYLQGHREKGHDFLPQAYWDAINAVGGNLHKAWVEGDWYVDFTGYIFRRSWFEIVDAAPIDFVKVVRYWDKAASADKGKYTAGVLIGKTRDKKYFVLNVIRGRWETGQREKVIKQTAVIDRATYGSCYWVIHEQEPGSGGLDSARETTKNLAGFRVKADKVSKSKDSRDRGLEPFAAQAQIGNVAIVSGNWVTDYLDELSIVPHSKVRDQADATGGAFRFLNKGGKGIHI